MQPPMRFNVCAVVAAAGLAAPAAGVFAGPAEPIVVFVHDQIEDEIYRLVDLNGDGDMHDPGEATLFYDDSPMAPLGIDNAQGLVALSPTQVLATDNFEPDNVLLLNDADGDGSALGAGESSVYFNGMVTTGAGLIRNPADLNAAPGGGYYLLDNNLLAPEDNSNAIWHLFDLNGDNDTNDPGEVTLAHEFGGPGDSSVVTLGMTVDDDGLVWYHDFAMSSTVPESIDTVDVMTGTITEFTDNSALFANLNLIIAGNELVFRPQTGEVIFAANNLGFTDTTLLAVFDNNGDGVLDNFGEIRIVWSESVSGRASGTPRDFWINDDGSLLFVDALQDEVVRLVDLNDDGDYQDAGETVVIYNGDTAAANGLFSLESPLSVTAAALDEPCIADITGDGVLNNSDINAFVTAFTTMNPIADLNSDGQYNNTDINAFVNAFLAGCD